MASSIPNASVTILSASGVITAVAPAATYGITAVGVAALTLAAPATDGIILRFVDEGGHAHTITSTGLLNGSHNVATFGGTAGSACELVSRNGFWWAVVLTGVAVS